MIILDSYAVIALLRDEPAAEGLEHLLNEHPDARLTALGLAEVLDYLVRLAGADEEVAVLDVAQLGLGNPTSVDAQLAVRAGLLRAQRYHRRECSISLADCVAAETARAANASLVTSDPHLLDVCHEEGIPLIAVRGTRGDTWHPQRRGEA